MRKFSFLITALLLTAPAWAQNKVMQIHSEGSVVYEIPTAQVDSVTFRAANEDDCDWTELQPVALTEQLKNVLNTVFSKTNELVKNIKGDTLLRVINSKEELLSIGCDMNTAIDIDFENQSIIWGRILTGSISDKISSTQLSVCSLLSDYKYTVVIKKCSACWWALDNLYFWEIYSQKIDIENISLIVKND